MGNRLSKIYTRTGDDGTTGLGNGKRVAKNSQRIEAIGDVDELNSCIGIVLTHTLPESVTDRLNQVQHDLFDLGGELSIPGHKIINTEQHQNLEQAIDDINTQLEPLKEFILPGGHPAAAHIHLARAICRRAERHTIPLRDEVNTNTLIYLNRLSDYLFVVARHINKECGVKDVMWQSLKRRNFDTKEKS